MVHWRLPMAAVSFGLLLLAGCADPATEQEKAKKDRPAAPKPELRKHQDRKDPRPAPAKKQSSPLEQRFTLDAHNGQVVAVAIAADGSLIASGGQEKSDGRILPTTVKLWDVAKRKELETWKALTGQVSCLAFAPDGKTLVAATHTPTEAKWLCTLRVWDVAAKKEKRPVDLGAGVIDALAFSKDGQVLAVAMSSARDLTYANQGRGIVRLVNMAMLRQRNVLRVYEGSVVSLRFRADGEQLTAGDNRGTIKCWDLKTGKVLTSQLDPKKPGPSLLRLLACKKDVLNGTNNSIDASYSTYNSSCGAFTSDGKILATGGRDNTIKLWEVETGKELASYEAHLGPVNDLAFTPDGRILVSASSDKTVIVWDVALPRTK